MTAAAESSRSAAAKAPVSPCIPLGAAFFPPDPEAIIQRFAKLEDEVSHIEEQLADYSQRQAVLLQQQAALRLQRGLPPRQNRTSSTHGRNNNSVV